MASGDSVVFQAGLKGSDIVVGGHVDIYATQAKGNSPWACSQAVEGVESEMVVIATCGDEKGAVHLSGDFEAQNACIEIAGCSNVADLKMHVTEGSPEGRRRLVCMIPEEGIRIERV